MIRRSLYDYFRYLDGNETAPERCGEDGGSNG